MATTCLLVNRYQLLDQLGAGSTGVVYRAIDRFTRETLALKRVTLFDKHEQLASQTMMDKDIFHQQDALRLTLAQEFKTLAGLRHPHIINVIDYGFDDERYPFFTMPLLEDARHFPAAGSEQPLETQVEYLTQTLQALAYLHRRGILHRDIKPGNVLVADGRVLVLDFGLSIERYTAQQRVGTAIYMAPETIRTGQNSIASDLYAVGTLAYEMWSGQHPFETGSKRLLMDILNKTPDVLILPEPVRPVVARLLDKDPADRYADAGEAIQALNAAIGQPAPRESAAIRESFLQAAKFVGRTAELGQLTNALEQAAQGNGSAWLMDGESGVGKSRLLDELRTQALVSGATVLRGQAVEGGGQPYQLWRAPLRHLTLMTELSNLEVGVVKPLVPDIQTLLGKEIPDAPALDGQAAQQRLYLTIAEICQAAAQKASPLVLLMEDLHWTSESLEPLKVLNRLVADLPLLVIGSYRGEERPGLPTECPYMRILPLARLSPESMAALSISMLGAAGEQPQVLNLLHKETEGNTFFLVETVRALAEEAGRLDAVGGMTLPEEVFAGGVQRIIQHRLERVPAEHRPLLKLAAVAGRALDLEILQAAMPQADIETWLTTCSNVAVLEVQEGNWRFTHDKLRAELMSGLAAAEHPALHRQVAEAYEHVYPDDPGYATVLTDHWETAGERGKAHRYARLAGDYAVEQYVNAEAVGFYGKALALTPADDTASRFDLLLSREAVYARLGQRTEQAADLAQLTILACTPIQQAEAALRYGFYHNNVGEYEAALEISEQARQWAAENGDREKQTQALINIAQAYQRQSNYETAAQTYHRAFELARVSGNQPQLAQTRSGIGEIAFHQGDYPTATQYHRQALDLRQKMDDQLGQINSLRNLGQVTNAQGDFEAARDYLLDALQLARQMGDRPNEARLLLNLGMSDWWQGANPQAEVYLQQSLELAQNVGDKPTAAAALKNLGLLANRRGQDNIATNYYEQSLAISQEIGDRTGKCAALGNLGSTALSQGQYDVAIDYYEQSLAIAQEIGNQSMESGTLNNLGLAAFHKKQYKKAIGYYEQSLAITKEIGRRSIESIMLSNLGGLAIEQGQFKAASDYLEQSLVISREIGDQSMESLTLNSLGLAAYTQRQYVHAKEYYEQSLSIKQETGTRNAVAYTLSNLGALALAQLEFQQAQVYYQQAFDIRQELNQLNFLVENSAGLALVALRRGDLQIAAEYAEQLLAYWSDNPMLKGVDRPMRTLHFTWQVCQGLALPQADDILAVATEVVQTYLDNHPDPETQAAYLAQPHHQALWTAWQEKQNNE